MRGPTQTSPGQEIAERGAQRGQGREIRRVDSSVAGAARVAGRETPFGARAWLALMLLSVLALMLAGSRFAGAAVPSEEYPITTNSKDKYSPATSGKIVVWHDTRNLNSDIYYRDLSTANPESQLTTDPSDQRKPAISGKTVIWEDNRNGNWDIYGYDLAAGGAAFPVATGAGDQRNPAISGKKVVWEDNSRGNLDIRGKDLSDGTVFPVAVGAGDQRDPAISGKKVVWSSQQTAGNSDIFARDLASGEVLQVANDPSWQASPDVSGDKVVWVDERNAGSLDIYSYDLSKKKESPVAVAAGDQHSPAVSDRIVVWADGRSPGTGIYGKDLSTGKEFAISTSSGPKDSPDIGEEKTVVWEVQRDGTSDFGVWDVYGADLDLAPAAPANLIATGSSQGIRLEWNRSGESDVVGYNVYRSDSAQGQYEKIAVLIQDPAHLDASAARGQNYRYRVTAVDARGSESAAARTGATIVASSALSLVASPATLNLGQGTTLSGRLTFDLNGSAEPAGGKPVVLEQKRAGADSFGPVPGGRLTTAPDGTFSLAGLKPRKNTKYRVRFGGEPGYRAAMSNPAVVRVRPEVLVYSPRTKPGSVSISGAVVPASSGKVALMLKRNSTVVARKVVGVKDFRFQTTFASPRRGKYSVQAFFLNSATHAANSSPAKHFFRR